MSAVPGLLLYYRHGCHLCEDMRRGLDAAGLGYRLIDIDADPTLQRAYGERVPVLAEADGEELCEFFLEPAVVARLRGQ